MRTYYDPLEREYVVSVNELEAAELADRHAFKVTAYGAVVEAHKARTAAEKRRIAKWNRRQFSS